MSIQISVNNDFSVIDDLLSQPIREIIRNTLSYQVDNAHFIPSVKEGRWDGMVYLVKLTAHSIIFPTGLLSLVLPILKQHNILFVIKDLRKCRNIPIQINWVGDSLRYYQEEAVEEALKRTRGIWEIATGGGKSLTAGRFFQKTGLPGLIVVQSTMAAQDTFDDLSAALDGATLGLWAGDSKTTGHITICTVQALLGASEQSPLYAVYLNADITIWDEVHSYGGGKFYIMALNANSYYKIGMSGTAYRKDSKEIMLSACTGKVIYKQKTASLQKQGFLAPSVIRFVQSPPPSHVTLRELMKMNKEDVYMNAIVLNEPRNRLLFKFLSEFENESIAISVRLITHGEILSDLTGIPFLNGKSSTQERKRIRDGLKSGEIKKVIGTSLIDQSVNFPLLKVFLNWAGYSPRVAQIQRLGRILRLSQGKTAYFIDLVDSWNTKMYKHSKQRISFMEKENLDVYVEKLNGKQYEDELESITDVII